MKKIILKKNLIFSIIYLFFFSFNDFLFKFNDLFVLFFKIKICFIFKIYFFSLIKKHLHLCMSENMFIIQ